VKKFTTLLIWQVPAELKKRFKAACVRRGTTMRAEVIKLMLKLAKGVVGARHSSSMH